VEGMGHSIPEEEIRRFEEDGAIVLRKLFSPDWLEELRVAAEENMKHPGGVHYVSRVCYLTK